MKPLAQERMHPADTRTVRTRRTEAIIVSGDDGFLIELGPVLGDRYRTRTVDHPDAIAAATDATRWIAIVDALALPDAHAAVTRLQRQFPGAEIIVVTKTSEEWTSAVSHGAVVATIGRDDLGSARLLALLAIAENRLAAHADDGVAGATRPASPGAGAGDSNAPPSASSLLLAIVFAVLGIACAGLLWSLAPASAYNPLSGLDVDPAANDNRTVVAPASVFELLSSARIAFHDQKLLPRADGEGRGDSALELYIQVLRQEPANEEALDGVRRLLAVGKARIQSDLASGKLDDATRLIGYFKSAGVEPEALHDVEASVAAARPKWLAAKAQESIAAGDLAAAEQTLAQMSAAGADRNSMAELRRAIDARKLDQQLGSMLNDVKAAIDAGALLDTGADSARARLQAMRNIGRNHPLTLEAQRDLQAALLARAQEATRKDQFDLAQRYLAAAADSNPTADLAEARRALQAQVDLAAQRSAAARTAPSAPSAGSAPSGGSDPVTPEATGSSSASYIAARPLSPINVTYPAAAAGSRIEGYVVIEFTLHADGLPSSPTVVEAQPTGVFDRAAITAVMHARYDSSGLIHKQSRRARIRLTFKPG